MQSYEKSPGPIKLLLSGGTGFLGSHIAKYFSESGVEVSILKRESSNLWRLKDFENNVKFSNIKDFSGGDFDIFINAASSYGRGSESDEEVFAANVQFPMGILDKLDLQKLILLNINTSLPSSVNYYSKTKHKFAEEVRKNHPNLKFSNLIVEQFYGPHDGTFLTLVIESLRKDDKTLALTSGEQERDVIYYADVIRAIEAVIRTYTHGDVPVGTGSTMKIRDIVLLVKKLMGNSSTELDFGAIPYRDNEVMESVADIKLLTGLNWAPEVSLEDGIKLTLEKW